MVTRKKKPKFNPLNYGFFKNVKKRWRKTRGSHNKKRMHFAWAGASPKIGYRNPEELRGLHPSGSKEILVFNPTQLDALDAKDKNQVLRVSGSVGGKKRQEIADKAKKLGFMIVNMREKNPRAKTSGAKAKPATTATPAAREQKREMKHEIKHEPRHEGVRK